MYCGQSVVLCVCVYGCHPGSNMLIDYTASPRGMYKSLVWKRAKVTLAMFMWMLRAETAVCLHTLI